jgi:hypothetical protein
MCPHISRISTLRLIALIAPLVTFWSASADGTVTLHYAENADGCWMMVEGDSSVYAVDLDTVQALLITAAALKAE